MISKNFRLWVRFCFLGSLSLLFISCGQKLSLPPSTVEEEVVPLMVRVGSAWNGVGDTQVFLYHSVQGRPVAQGGKLFSLRCHSSAETVTTEVRVSNDQGDTYALPAKRIPDASSEYTASCEVDAADLARVLLPAWPTFACTPSRGTVLKTSSPGDLLSILFRLRGSATDATDSNCAEQEWEFLIVGTEPQPSVWKPARRDFVKHGPLEIEISGVEDVLSPTVLSASLSGWNHVLATSSAQHLPGYNAQAKFILPTDEGATSPLTSRIVWDQDPTRAPGLSVDVDIDPYGRILRGVIYVTIGALQQHMNHWIRTVDGETGPSIAEPLKETSLCQLSAQGVFPPNWSDFIHFSSSHLSSSDELLVHWVKGALVHAVGHIFGLADDHRGSLTARFRPPTQAASVMDDLPVAAYYLQLNATRPGPLDRQQIHDLYGGPRVSSAPPLEQCLEGRDINCQRGDLGLFPLNEFQIPLAEAFFALASTNGNVGPWKELLERELTSIFSWPAEHEEKSRAEFIVRQLKSSAGDGLARARALLVSFEALKEGPIVDQELSSGLGQWLADQTDFDPAVLQLKAEMIQRMVASGKLSSRYCNDALTSLILAKNRLKEEIFSEVDERVAFPDAVQTLGSFFQREASWEALRRPYIQLVLSAIAELEAQR